MNKMKKTLVGSGAALFGAGYIIGRRQHDDNKSAYQKVLDKLEKALD